MVAHQKRSFERHKIDAVRAGHQKHEWCLHRGAVTVSPTRLGGAWVTESTNFAPASPVLVHCRPARTSNLRAFNDRGSFRRTMSDLAA